MKTIDSEARELQKSLNTVNKSLKFNESDPSLLAQRFTLINEQIDTTKERLKQLIEYEKIAREQFENGTISKSQYSSLTREISKTRNELQGLEHDSKEAFDSLKTSILGAKDKLSEFTKAAIAAGAALAVNKLKDLGSQAIETASDLREVQNVVDTSFGDLAYMMEDLADKAIDVYGISKLTAKETGSTFMSMAKGMDIVPQSAAEMSIALTELSADMASFYNVEQQVAATALNSVFTGETETLKKFGVVMTEANLNAFALSQGIEKTVKQMDQAEKVQLRYNYVMQQTSLAQGDFAKTSGEWANRSRVLKEEITELSSMVGEELINNLGDVQSKADSLFDLVRDAKESGQLSAVIGDVTAALNKLIDMFVRAVEFIYKYRTEITTAAQAMITLKASMKIASTITGIIKAITSLKGALTALTSSTKAQTTAQTALNASMSINPVVALITAILTLASVISVQLVKSATRANEEFLKMSDAEKAVSGLKESVDELNDSLEKSAQTRQDNISSVENEYGSYKNLANQLYALADKQDKTAEDYKRINTLVDNLNSNIPNLGLSFDSVTKTLNMQRDVLIDLIDDYETYYKTAALQGSLTQMYKDQYEAEQKLKEAKEEDQKALERVTAAEEEYRVKQDIYDQRASKVSLGVRQKLQAEVDAAKSAADAANLARNTTKQAVNETSAAYSKLGKDIAAATDYISQNADTTNKIADRIADSTSSLEEQSKSVEELTESYKSAKDAISGYSSELSSLVSLQKELSEGNELSSFEMLELIEKYPELISKIKETENGYTLEKQAIEDLIDVRLVNLKLAAQEKQAAAEALFYQNKGNKGQLESIKKLVDNGSIKDISALAGEQYTDGLYEAIENYAYQKGLDSLLSDIINDGFKEGSKSSGSNKADTDDISGYFKALEHEHNMGRKSDEQYYNELETLNNRYYKNSKDNLDKYWSYEEKIYAYRKKAAEELAKTEEKSNADNVKSLESLKSKIYDVIDARNELNGIRSNKNVQTYDSATGFKYEADQTKLKKAYEDLAKKQDALLIEKLGLGNNNSELISTLKGMISSLEKAGISGPLPDLKKAYSELKQAGGNVTNNKSYTLNFGDVYTDGSKEDLEDQLARVLEELVRKADRE
jgi:chromosome segregation ATPase